MRVGVLGAAFLVLSLTSSIAQDVSEKPYEINDAYEIYSVLLPGAVPYGFRKGPLVIQQETVSNLPSFYYGCLDLKAQSKFEDALDDFFHVTKRVWLLQRNFRIEQPYELVSLDTFFQVHRKEEGWKNFFERYPCSGGLIEMSPVGFNKTKTQAVVYTGHGCGLLCGFWGFHLFEKVDGKWKEAPGVTCTIKS